MKKIIASIMILVGSASALHAAESRTPQLLSVAKAAGKCEMMNSLLTYKDTADPSHAEFVIKFQEAEAIKMKKNVDEYMTQCEKALNAYSYMWQVANK